jgi:hypothetical protein
MRKVLILGVCGAVVLGAAAFFFFSGRPGADVLGGARAPDGMKGPAPASARIPGEGGGPLFRFGNPYLDGRSAWLAARFREEREALRSAAAPPEPAVRCVVHRQPFTEGPWVDALPPDLARRRKEIEGQAVESRISLFVPSAAPAAVLRYLAASGFRSRLPDEGKTELEFHFPPLDPLPAGLRSAPPLAPNEWLVREKFKRPMAYPTDAFHVQAAFREGDVLAQVAEAWENVPGEGMAAVNLSAVQYAAVPRPGGTLVAVLSYYSGQSIPPLLDRIAAGMTEAHWRKVAALVREEAPAWQPPPDLARRLEALGI